MSIEEAMRDQKRKQKRKESVLKLCTVFNIESYCQI